MLKPIKFLKRVQGFCQHVFNLLPIVSFGGISLILGTFAIAPNFMNFAHAEENVVSPKQKDITLSMSVNLSLHEFDDVYLTSLGKSQESDKNTVSIIPKVQTNNPAGYKIFFSDADEDTNMRSIESTVTDSIRSATSADFENGEPKNTTDNYWYCGIINGAPDGYTHIQKTNSNNNDLSVPTKNSPKMIEEVKYVRPNESRSKGVHCSISINKQLAPSTYADSVIFSSVANTNNLINAKITNSEQFFRKARDVGGGFSKFKYTKPWNNYSEHILNDGRIVSQLKSDYEIFMGQPSPSCPAQMEMYDAAESEEMEPILMWRSGCERSLNWWTPSGTLTFGEDCSSFFASGRSPRFDGIDLSNVDISNCKNMESMFERNDDGFKVINFGNNKFSPELKNTKKMFKNNPNLINIIVAPDTDLKYVPESDEMFLGDFKLRGYKSWRYHNGKIACTSLYYEESHGVDATNAVTGGYLHDGSNPDLCQVQLIQ